MHGQPAQQPASLLYALGLCPALSSQGPRPVGVEWPQQCLGPLPQGPGLTCRPLAKHSLWPETE